MKYLAILGRQPEISVAELEALGCSVEGVYQITKNTFSPQNHHFSANLLDTEKLAAHGLSPNGLSVAKISTPDEKPLDIDRLGGTQKLAVLLSETPLEVLKSAPEGKLTFAITDFSTPDTKSSTSHNPKNPKSTKKSPKSANFATTEALKIKRELVKQGRSVRVVEGKSGVVPTATNLYNGLSGKNPRKIEFIHFQDAWYRITGVQDIDAYAERDQNRPARDAKIGMLPPKLAQVLLNLAGALPPHSRILDPFCGTGVVLQEALLMGYQAYGTDISSRMVAYAHKNLAWLLEGSEPDFSEDPELRRGQARRPRDDGRRTHRRLSVAQRSSRASEKFGSEPYEVLEGDARTSFWKQPLDAIVTEGYLGKPFSHLPSDIEIKTEVQEVKPLILEFLENLASQLKSGTPVVMAAPAWLRKDGEYLRLNILDEIADLGYNVGDKTREGLLYHRSGQVVARDIIILRKK